ncbi:MAG: hypothetical protein IT444_04740 [Phycisphaeraceae bacterium]|nr:hypothetical protein [Phycisphaeraceae bacterium]
MGRGARQNDEAHLAGYRRADLARLPGDADHHLDHEVIFGTRWTILPISLFLCVFQSVLWIAASNLRYAGLAGTLIPVLGFPLLVIAVLGVNPILRFVHRHWGGPRPLGRAELTVLFVSMLITAGISTYGLVEQLVPLIAAPFNPDWNTPQRGWNQQLIPSLNRHLYITDPSVIAQFREGIGPAPNPTDSVWVHAAFYLHVIVHIPWLEWLKPIAWWMLYIVPSYLLFYSLTYVVLPFWSRREKITFPLAKLPESLLPDHDTDRVLPPIFRTHAFWIGFAITFVITAWNASVQAYWLGPGVGQILTGMSAWRLDPILQGTFLEGMSHSIAVFFIFTAVGLAFLLPAEMSFSIWFYYLLGRLMILIATWLGYGRTAADFPSNFLWDTNFVSAQGGGGMMMFSAISLYRCVRRYHELAIRRPFRERFLLTLPVIGLFFSITVLTFWFRWNHLPLGWSLIFVLVLTLLTLGLMRIVAEGGIYWFQTHTGFFHIYKMTGLGKLLSGATLAPILPIYSLFFFDPKAFIAPSMLNGAKMCEDAGANRIRYHVTVISSVVASVIAGLFFALVLAYSRGADRMHYWFYGIMPRDQILETAMNVIRQPPTMNVVNTTWLGAGGLWVALSLYLRQTVFWFPHPIGYIMLINPLMDQLWLSFFIAWMLKRLVIRYGGKATFDHARLVAIGVITGELMAIAIWSGIALVSGVPIGNIDLNRYGP